MFPVLFGVFIGLFAASVLSAWTGPTGTAPGSNVTAPINAGTVDQVKNAGLSVNAFTVFGSQYIQNKLGIATATPAVALDVNGTIKVGNAGEVCQSVTAGAIRYNSSSNKIQYCNGTVWGPIAEAPSTNLTIASDATNYNIFTAAGSPTSAVTLILTINSGVKVGSFSTATPGLTTGTFPAGSVITIVNNGSILGAGGAGGIGGLANGAPGTGTAGSTGGPALSLSYPVTITNNGIIGGGGGGGGGGVALTSKYSVSYGGGGGGGCGYVAGTGGTGGSAGASRGSSGTSSAGGAGGATDGGGGGAGGSGGACGQYGATGSANYWGLVAGSSGGAPGAAVITNGNAITWTSGNNGTQVLGAVQ
jgi:hypothetical protein